jgi:nucleoside-diphosphate-sugar epimerase
MSRPAVSIMGCGWLGLPLAKRFLQEGFQVKGSTTQEKKLKILQDAGIEPFLISVDEEGFDLSGSKDFFKSDVLFLNIPFRRNLEDPYIYREQISSVIQAAEKNVGTLIMASSTSAYSPDVADAREDLDIVSRSVRQKALLDTEQDVLNSPPASVVLRFAGLVGPGRKIGGSLYRGDAVSGADDPVNLVHLEDCIEVVLKIVQRRLNREIFNVCSDIHPTKRELYTESCRMKSVALPEFVEPYRTSVKIVNNQKIKNALNYSFKYSHPFDILKHE